MIKIIVNNNRGENHLVYQATQQLAEEFVAQRTLLKSWGKPERILSQYDLGDENINHAIETTIVNDVTYYKFASEFTVEYQDATAEITMQNNQKKRRMKRDFGEAMIDKISTINDSKSLSVEQVDAFMSNALIANLREHLWAGNISTFVSKLAASDVSAFFTNVEKTVVINECQQFLLSIEG